MIETETAIEQTEDSQWLAKWLANWDSLGKDPMSYSRRRSTFRELVRMGQVIPEARPLVTAVVRQLGPEASEFVQLCYVEAGRPPIKN